MASQWRPWPSQRGQPTRATGAAAGPISMDWQPEAQELRLSGPGVSAAFRSALQQWLKEWKE